MKKLTAEQKTRRASRKHQAEQKRIEATLLPGAQVEHEKHGLVMVLQLSPNLAQIETADGNVFHVQRSSFVKAPPKS